MGDIVSTKNVNSRVLEPRPDLALPEPDGRLVEHMRRAELGPALIKLGIPGVTSQDAKVDMLDAYAAWVEARRQELREQEEREADGPAVY